MSSLGKWHTKIAQKEWDKGRAVIIFRDEGLEFWYKGVQISEKLALGPIEQRDPEFASKKVKSKKVKSAANQGEEGIPTDRWQRIIDIKKENVDD